MSALPAAIPHVIHVSCGVAGRHMMTEHIAVARASFRRNLGQKADREGGAFRVQERAEVHRLFHRERCPKAAIAERLGMSRTTLPAAGAHGAAPLQRELRPSLLDCHKAKIAELGGSRSSRTTYRESAASFCSPRDASAPATSRRDRPRRLVGATACDPRGQEPHPAALRLRHHPSALRCPRGCVQLS